MVKKCISLAIVLCSIWQLGFCQNPTAPGDTTVQLQTEVIEKDSPPQKETSDQDKTPYYDSQNLSQGDFRSFINKFWVIIAAFLVFFMQAGFKVFEVGLVRKIDGNSVGFKNLADWLIVMLVFWAVGFAIMFGNSDHGAIRMSFWGLADFEGSYNTEGRGYEYFLFQMAFAATAVTIVSGALAVRIKLLSYMVLALLIAAIIYPIFGHLAWGNLFSEEGYAWLAELGFHDFAGSTVVHSVGAWVAITGMWFIRPRMGKRIGKRNQIVISVPNEEHDKFEPHNLGYSVLGVIILWIGWWGFNGGSADLLVYDKDFSFTSEVPSILLNTNLGGALGGLAAFAHALWFQNKKKLFEKTLGGVLGGLVAITAGCDVLTPGLSMLVGFLAGILHNISYDRLNDKALFGKIIDDPVGAIPVHGVCGILGTLCVAFADFGETGPSFFTQFGIQLLGVVVCAVFTVGISILFFYLLRRTLGLEIEPDQESLGETI